MLSVPTDTDRSRQEVEFLVARATTKSNMADKHQIERILLRAHLRQELDCPWLLSERLYIYLMKQTNRQEET